MSLNIDESQRFCHIVKLKASSPLYGISWRIVMTCCMSQHNLYVVATLCNWQISIIIIKLTVLFQYRHCNNITRVVFTFLLLSSHLLNAIVCIIKSFLCHNVTQAMSYYIMEFYVTTCHIYVKTIAASLPQSFICANEMLALNGKLIEYVI